MCALGFVIPAQAGIQFKVPRRGSVNPSPLGDWEVQYRNERLQGWQSHGMGLQISSGMDYEVPLSGIGRRRRSPGEGVVARDIAKYGIDDLRRSNQS